MTTLLGRRRFAIVLAVSLALKLALAIGVRDITPRYDEFEYLTMSRAVLEGELPGTRRPPGYPWFGALGLLLGGGNAIGIRILQVFASVLTSWFVFRIGRRAWGEPAGFAAGTFVAFYPSHVAFSHLIWSETIYTLLIVAAFDTAMAAVRRDSLPRLAAAGIVLGLAALTRSTALVLAAAGGLVLLAEGRGRGRRTWLRPMVLGGAALATILPWSLVASRDAGAPVLIDLNGGFNVWSGNNAYIADDLQSVWVMGLQLQNGVNYPLQDAGWFRKTQQRQRMAGVRDLAGSQRWYLAQAGETIRRDPGAALARIPRKIAALWAPDTFLPRHLLRDWYGRTPPALAGTLTLLVWLTSAVPLLLGPAAVGLLRGGALRRWILAWGIGYLVVHALTFGSPRMHQPLVPLLVLAVAGAIAERPPRLRVVRRGLPAVGVALGLWIFYWPIVAGLYISPGPRHVAFARFMAASRHVPLPGSDRLTWMLAGVEGAAGHKDRAYALLEERQVAGRDRSDVLRRAIERDR